MKRVIIFFISLAICIGVIVYGDTNYITLGDDGYFLGLFVGLISLFVCLIILGMWLVEQDEKINGENKKLEYKTETYLNFNLDDAIKDIQPRILDNGKMRWDIYPKLYHFDEYDYMKTKTDICAMFKNVKKAPSYEGDRSYYADENLGDNKFARVIIDLELQTITYLYIEEWTATKQEENERKASQQNKPSSVYLLFNPLNNTYKIGKANDVNKRLRTFQTGTPDIKLVTYKTYANEKQAFQMENMLHSQYQDNNYKKEWFNLNEEDVEFIKQTLS